MPICRLFLVCVIFCCCDLKKPLPNKKIIQLESNDNFATNEKIWAQHYVLKSRLETDTIKSFAILAPGQRQILDELSSRWNDPIHVYTLAERALILLPEQHPAGPLELVLSDDLNKLIVFSENKKPHTVSRSKFPDILDCTTYSLRTEFDFDSQATSKQPNEKTAHIITSIYQSALSFSYKQKGSQPTQWRIKMLLRMFTREEPKPFPFQQTLLHLAMPLAQNQEGLQALESLAMQTNDLLGWRISIRNTNRPDRSSPTIVTQVEDKRWEKIPVMRFSKIRKTLARITKNIPRNNNGLQFVPPKELGKLRTTKDKGPLQITNASNFAVYIYVDGINLGWVAPGKEMSFNGLGEGFYRVYAVTPTGVYSWGPYDMYVPGPLTLKF